MRSWQLGVAGMVDTAPDDDPDDDPNASVTRVHNGEDFEARIQSDATTLVQFFAPWSGRCRQVRSMVDRVANDMSIGIDFTRVDIEELADVAERHAAERVPTIVVYQRGVEQARLSGSLTEADLRRLVVRCRPPYEA